MPLSVKTFAMFTLLKPNSCAGFDRPDPRKGHILVELKTANAVKLTHYCTSARVIAMPTAQLNARRYLC